MKIRELKGEAITEAVRQLCLQANRTLPADVKAAMDQAIRAEPWPLARQTLGLLEENLGAAAQKELPICQDTGMACVFIELGQDVHVDGDLTAAVDEGVRRGYTEGYLRKSITGDPLQRKNTEDNTPAFLTLHLVPGDRCRITVAPKGAGSENMSRLGMLKPADGVQGVGVGGSFDHCAALAKRALLRPLDTPNPDPYYAALEKELLQAVNALGIGPQGFGGATTCLGVSIEQAPTHVACLPVAVNISCHVTRRASVVL